MSRYKNVKRHGKYRSGAERDVAKILQDKNVQAEHEPFKLTYEQPAKDRKYNPDFVLDDGTILEVKGQFPRKDRQKMQWVIAAHPDRRIVMVFCRPSSPIQKNSKTTVAEWCDSRGIEWTSVKKLGAWLESQYT